VLDGEITQDSTKEDVLNYYGTPDSDDDNGVAYAMNISGSIPGYLFSFDENGKILEVQITAAQ
jgi:hypothetical protein